MPNNVPNNVPKNVPNKNIAIINKYKFNIMPIKKGTVLNPNGRPKGVPNKATSDLRMKINAIVDKQIDSIERDLQSLEPMQRLQIVEKLISYCVPKLQAQSFEIDFQNLSEQQLDFIISQLNFNDDDSDE